MLRLRRHDQLVVFEDPGPELDESANDRGVREFLRRGHFYEEAFLDYIRSLRLVGAYVDAGAFIGTHTVYFAMLCDAEHVYAFEPRPQPRGELERNVAANQLEQRVTVTGLGLAAARQTASADFDDRLITFDCVPMDDVVDRPVALIKIDVEGMEVDVLRGATRILGEDHPAVFAEAHTFEHRQAISDLLAEHGYARTGRVFNSSPTYEFVYVGEAQGSETVRRAYEEIGRLSDKLASELTSVRTSLTEAQLRYRGAVAEVQRLSSVEKTLTAAKEASDGRLREAEAEVARLRSKLPSGARAIAEVAQLRAKLLSSTRAIHDLTAQTSRLERELLVAVSRRDRLHNSLWLQLGRSLVRAGKSRKGLLALPKSLLALRREAARRRQSGPGTMPEDDVVHSEGLISVYTRPPRSSPKPAPERFPPPASLARADCAPSARLAELRVACIMDEFTAMSFGPECRLLHLRPTGWEAMLERFRPDLLFVESAWRGQDEAWVRKIGHGAPELRGILDWCRARRVPTAFWNKEDPVHFATFRNTADLFDVVFTTDVDCVHRYKHVLGHDRVFVLPFACQPESHNPLEKYERKDALCFAGAYYARYPERQRDFLGIINELQAHWPVEIFDRNYGDTNPDYQFPEAYQHLVVGKLPFDQIDRAYKGYQYAINLNSIKYSQSMFARRVFEVVACNTVTVSNYSRGIRLLLGDLVITTDDPRRQLDRIREISASPASLRKFKLRGLRKVLTEHTYADRLHYIASVVFGVDLPTLLPGISVLGIAQTAQDTRRVVQAFRCQVYPHKRLYLLAPQQLCAEIGEAADVDCLPLDTAGNTELAGHLDQHAWIATFVAADYYGPHYLSDLAVATRYWRGVAVGKASHYEWRDGGAVLVDDGLQYRAAGTLAARAAIMTRAALGQVTVGEFAARGESYEVDRWELLATDEMSYCREAGAHAGDGDLSAAVDDFPGLDVGLPLPALLDTALAIEPREHSGDDTLRALAPPGLARVFSAGKHKDIVIVHDLDGMVLSSTLGSEQFQYVYGALDLDPAALGFSTTGDVFVDATPGLILRVVVLFLDGAGDRIDHVITSVQTNHRIDVPPDTRAVRFGFRALGPGRATVKAIVLGNVSSDEPTRVIGRSDVLVLTNTYPSNDDLYRNAFVHRRVVEYARRGKRVDVFCLRHGQRLGYYEFDDVDVTRGGAEALEAVLATRQHHTVGVHFLDKVMWRVLEPRLDRLRVIVWVHGSEIQPWHRRSFNYSSTAEVDAAKAASSLRIRFWQSVLREPHPNVRLVFVSQHFADEVQEDLGIDLPKSSYQIIHNLIDTELFTYEPKDAEQRKRILTIRPFASRKYANDLSVKAILDLAEKPFFDDLEFRIIGDGALFEETVGPLRGLSNVIVDRRFLTQAEIAALHKEYGVFLTPTRMDAQGVSRDEAMASGLVPVTSSVTAVPEFVDVDCGFLAPYDDASGLADAIETLYHDPERFERMSAAAAARVRGQSGPDLTAGREIVLFGEPG